LEDERKYAKGELTREKPFQKYLGTVDVDKKKV